MSLPRTEDDEKRRGHLLLRSLAISRDIVPLVGVRSGEQTILSFVDRLPDPFGDDRRIFVESEQHRPLEALWPGDDHSHSTMKWIGSNPSLVLLFDVPSSSLEWLLANSVSTRWADAVAPANCPLLAADATRAFQPRLHRIAGCTCPDLLPYLAVEPFPCPPPIEWLRQVRAGLPLPAKKSPR